jgi:hypothetical protein
MLCRRQPCQPEPRLNYISSESSVREEMHVELERNCALVTVFGRFLAVLFVMKRGPRRSAKHKYVKHMGTRDEARVYVCYRPVADLVMARILEIL